LLETNNNSAKRICEIEIFYGLIDLIDDKKALLQIRGSERAKHKERYLVWLLCMAS
jgi:hypothetical protein